MNELISDHNIDHQTDGTCNQAFYACTAVAKILKRIVGAFWKREFIGGNIAPIATRPGFYIL